MFFRPSTTPLRTPKRTTSWPLIQKLLLFMFHTEPSKTRSMGRRYGYRAWRASAQRTRARVSCTADGTANVPLLPATRTLHPATRTVEADAKEKGPRSSQTIREAYRTTNRSSSAVAFPWSHERIHAQWFASVDRLPILIQGFGLPCPQTKKRYLARCYYKRSLLLVPLARRYLKSTRSWQSP